MPEQNLCEFENAEGKREIEKNLIFQNNPLNKNGSNQLLLTINHNSTDIAEVA